jgi:peptide/nickel transport system permease protein
LLYYSLEEEVNEMKRYIASKIFSMIISILALFTLGFIIFRLLPGDPISLMLRDPRLTEDQIKSIKAKFGLDKPLWEQYVIYIVNVFKGELGISIYYKKPVSNILLDRLSNSLILLIPSTIYSIVLGVLIGTLCAWRRSGFASRLTTTISLVLYSLPTYWLGGILILISINFLGLPVSGMYSYGIEYLNSLEKFLDLLSHMILPSITLTLVSFGGFTVITWSAMVDIIREDFVWALHAMGYPSRVIYFKHVLRNALIPIVSVSAIAIGTTVAGAVFTETIFAWPGIGRLIYEAVIYRDYPLLQGSFLIITTSVIIANTLADMLYGFLDPRVRRS